LALIGTLPLEGRGPQTQTSAKPPQTTAAGTGTPGRSSTPQDPPRQDGQRGADPSRPGARPDWLWWQDEAVKKELALNEVQVRRIDNLYQQRQKDMKPIVDAFMKDTADLDKLTSEMLVSPEELRLQVVKVQALRGEINTSRTIMLYRTNLLLTADQRKKLPDIWGRHFGRGRGAGPGR
jgi:hypothetical protein